MTLEDTLKTIENKRTKAGPLTSRYKMEKKIKKKKKKMKKWARTLGSFRQMVGWHRLNLYWFVFCFVFFFFLNKLNPVSAEIVRNDRNGSKRPEI